MKTFFAVLMLCVVVWTTSCSSTTESSVEDVIVPGNNPDAPPLSDINIDYSNQIPEPTSEDALVFFFEDKLASHFVLVGDCDSTAVQGVSLGEPDGLGRLQVCYIGTPGRSISVGIGSDLAPWYRVITVDSGSGFEVEEIIPIAG